MESTSISQKHNSSIDESTATSPINTVNCDSTTSKLDTSSSIQNDSIVNNKNDSFVFHESSNLYNESFQMAPSSLRTNEIEIEKHETMVSFFY